MKKKLCAAAAAALAIMTVGTSAFAATSNRPTAGGLTMFDKYLVMEKEANVPNAKPVFTIAAGDAVDATAETPKVEAGIEANKITISAEPFKPGDATYESAQGVDTVSLDTNQKYAKKRVVVDFSRVTFQIPGIYRYVITEAEPSEQGISISDGSTRVIDVYVVTNEAGNLSISGYILHDGNEVMKSEGGEYGFDNDGTKDEGFSNIYKTHNIWFENQTTGNQGDRSEYFEYKVEITGAEPGTKYDVNLNEAERTVNTKDGTKTNPMELVVGNDGTLTATYYLKDDQKVHVYGLTEDTSFRVTDIINDDTGYKVSYELDNSTPVKEKVSGPNLMGDDDHGLIFTNYRNGIVPTGILMQVWPFIAAAAALIVIGAFFTFMKKASGNGSSTGK